MTTLAEVESCGQAMLTPADIAPLFPCDPHSIRLQARENPTLLGFPVVCIGKRTYIPAEGFVNFCRAVGIGGSHDEK